MKKLCIILPMALILCFMVGCQDKETMAELEEFRAQAKVEEQNKEIVRLYAKLESEGKIEELEKIVAPNCIINNAGIPNVIGLEEIKKDAGAFYAAFPDMRHTFENQIAEGDMVSPRYTWSGTHTGEFMGIAPTGKKITSTFIDICRISDGKMVEAWVEFDALGLMQQLGFTLTPPQPPEPGEKK